MPICYIKTPFDFIPKSSTEVEKLGYFLIKNNLRLKLKLLLLLLLFQLKMIDSAVVVHIVQEVFLVGVILKFYALQAVHNRL